MSSTNATRSVVDAGRAVVADAEPGGELLEEPLEHAANATVALMITAAALVVRM
jgi:hypothetical protein